MPGRRQTCGSGQRPAASGQWLAASGWRPAARASRQPCPRSLGPARVTTSPAGDNLVEVPGLSDLVRRVDVPARSRQWAGHVLSSLAVRARVGRLMCAASPGLAISVLLFVLVEGFLPTLALVAIGWATGRIPAAVAAGLGSPAGHALLVSLAVGAGAYGLSLLRSPLEDLLSAHSSAVMTSDLQRRLTRAVSAPAGVEHLEDPEVLDRLSSATGELSSARPGDAPMTLAGVLGDRFAGLLACAVLASFRWWVGLMFLVGWCAIRPPLRSLLASRATLVRRATPALRHSWYYLGCAWRPECAKEMRIFGLGQWVLDRHRQKWLEGMAPSWAEARHFERRAMRLSAVVCAMYIIGAGEVGLAAYRGEVGLRTVTVMLPMFMLAAQVGGVSADDVALEQMLAAVPDVEGIVASLSRPDLASGGVAGRGPAPFGDPLRGRRVPVPGGRHTRPVRPRPLPPRRALAGHSRRERRRQDHSGDLAGPPAGAHRGPYHRRRPTPGRSRRPFLATPGGRGLPGFHPLPIELSRQRGHQRPRRRGRRGGIAPGRRDGRCGPAGRGSAARLGYGTVLGVPQRHRPLGRPMAAGGPGPGLLLGGPGGDAARPGRADGSARRARRGRFLRPFSSS